MRIHWETTSIATRSNERNFSVSRRSTPRVAVLDKFGARCAVLYDAVRCSTVRYGEHEYSVKAASARSRNAVTREEGESRSEIKNMVRSPEQRVVLFN